MDIPQTDLYKYLNEKRIMGTPVVLVDKRVYSLERHNKVDGNFFRWRDKVFSLHEGSTLSDLEESYLRAIPGEIESCIKSSLSSLKEEERKLLEKQNLTNLEDNKYLARVVIDAMVPIFSKNPADMARGPVMESKNGCTAKPDALQSGSCKSMAVSRFFESKGKGQGLVEDIGCVVDGVLSKDLIMMEDSGYLLEKIPEVKRTNFFIYLNGRIYDITRRFDFNLEKFDESYRGKIVEAIREKAMRSDSSLASRMKELAKDRETLELLAQKRYFDPVKKVGFAIVGGVFYACSYVDDSYIFYDPHNKRHYGFGQKFGKKPAVIGVSVERQNGGFSIGKPVVLNAYKHPSLKDRSEYGEGEHQEICTGKYSPPDFSDKESLPSFLSVILSTTGNTFTHGYSSIKEWKKLHEPNDVEYWKSHLLAPCDVDKNLVTNRGYIKSS